MTMSDEAGRERKKKHGIDRISKSDSIAAIFCRAEDEGGKYREQRTRYLYFLSIAEIENGSVSH